MQKVTTYLLGVLSFLSFSFSPFSQACDLPVCDIPAAIQELKDQSQAFRYERLRILNRDFRKNQRLDIAVNLKSFGLEAKKVVTQLGDENYIIHEANTLIDLGYFQMASLGAFSFSNLKEVYFNVVYPTSRLDVLNFVLNRIKSVEELDALKDIYEFARVGKIYSETLEDPEYVFEKFRFISGIIAERIGQVNPYQEGVYDVRFECEKSESDPKCPQLVNERFIMVVMNTFDNYAANQLVVTFLEYSTDRVFARFPNADFDVMNSVLSGRTSPLELPAAHFKMTVDSVTGRVSGWIRSTRYRGNILLTGSQTVTPSTYYRDQGPPAILNPEDVEGVYNVKFDETESKIIIKLMDTNRYAASLFNRNDELELDYSHGMFNSKRGVLGLVSIVTRSNAKKLVAAYRVSPETGEAGWIGFTYSTVTGEINSVRFTRINDVVPPPRIVRAE